MILHKLTLKSWSKLCTVESVGGASRGQSSRPSMAAGVSSEPRRCPQPSVGVMYGTVNLVSTTEISTRIGMSKQTDHLTARLGEL